LGSKSWLAALTSFWCFFRFSPSPLLDGYPKFKRVSDLWWVAFWPTYPSGKSFLLNNFLCITNKKTSWFLCCATRQLGEWTWVEAELVIGKPDMLRRLMATAQPELSRLLRWLGWHQGWIRLKNRVTRTLTRVVDMEDGRFGPRYLRTLGNNTCSRELKRNGAFFVNSAVARAVSL
jgi:hypothetical protein